MKKRIINDLEQQDRRVPVDTWLPLRELVDVELSSESASHPIEGAIDPGQQSGWRADAPGQQTIRLLFRQPSSLRRIAMRFIETDTERTQEYVLRWSPDNGRSFREIVRQQWHFSPRGSTEEVEDHQVELPDVTVLELTIIPDKSGGDAVASLAKLDIA